MLILKTNKKMNKKNKRKRQKLLEIKIKVVSLKRINPV